MKDDNHHMAPFLRVRHHRWSAVLSHTVDAMTNKSGEATHEQVDTAERIIERLVTKGFITNPRGGGLGQ